MRIPQSLGDVHLQLLKLGIWHGYEYLGSGNDIIETLLFVGELEGEDVWMYKALAFTKDKDIFHVCRYIDGKKYETLDIENPAKLLRIALALAVAA